MLCQKVAVLVEWTGCDMATLTFHSLNVQQEAVSWELLAIFNPDYVSRLELAPSRRHESLKFSCDEESFNLFFVYLFRQVALSNLDNPVLEALKACADDQEGDWEVRPHLGVVLAVQRQDQDKRWKNVLEMEQGIHHKLKRADKSSIGIRRDGVAIEWLVGDDLNELAALELHLLLTILVTHRKLVLHG